MHDFVKYYPIVKVDERTHKAYGVVTNTSVDSSNERCLYDETVPYYRKWSDDALTSTTNAGQEPSYGNIRLQHSLEIAGKITRLVFDDVNKQILAESEPVNDEIWTLLKRGFCRGYSQGGRYILRRCELCRSAITKSGSNYCNKCNKDVVVEYVSSPSEVSYVDVPALPDATFQYVRTDGTSELRKFATNKSDMTKTTNRNNDTNLEERLHALAQRHREISELLTSWNGMEEAGEAFAGMYDKLQELALEVSARTISHLEAPASGPKTAANKIRKESAFFKSIAVWSADAKRSSDVDKLMQDSSGGLGFRRRNN